MSLSSRGASLSSDPLQQLTRPGSLFELDQRVVNGVSYRTYARAPKSLGEIYRRGAKMGEAVLASCDGEVLRFSSAVKRGEGLGVALRQRLGVRPGMRVGLALADPLRWITVFLATTSLGAVPVLLPDTTAGTVEHCLRLTDCHVVVADESALDLLASGRSAGVIPFDTLMRMLDPSAPAPIGEDRADAEVLIAFTSGTSAPPKAVLVSSSGLITGLMNMMLSAYSSPAGSTLGKPPRVPGATRPTVLLLSPLSHVGGYCQLLLSLMTGKRLLFTRHGDSGAIASLMESESVTSLSGATPNQLEELMGTVPLPERLSSVGINGISSYPRLLRNAAAQWPQVTFATGYGLTETNGTIASISGDALLARPGCCGKVVPTVEVQLIGDDGAEVGSGAHGEIWVHGSSLMTGYCNPGGPPTGLHEGWFRTGDLGSLTMDGYLLLSGRAEDSRTIGGREVSASEIEAAIYEEPWVLEAAVVFPAPGADGVPPLVAAIVPKPRAEGDTRQLTARIQERFELTPSLFSVNLRDKLPRNRTGKVDRATLRTEVFRFVC